MKEIYCSTSSEIPPIKFTDHIRFECYWKFNFLGFLLIMEKLLLYKIGKNLAPVWGCFTEKVYSGVEMVPARRLKVPSP